MVKKRGTSRWSTTQSNLSFLDKSELKSLEKARDILQKIATTHKLDLQDITTLISDEVSFPSSIFDKKLTVLEAVTKYFKENRSFSLHKISVLLKRDERNIWHVYNRAKNKVPQTFTIQKNARFIPVSAFSSKLSALESIALFLKNKGLSNHEIAIILKRNDRTIWTVISRAIKKLGGGDK